MTPAPTRPVTRGGPRRYRAEAIVLKTIPFGETSQVVHLATGEHGLVAALAKGARRGGSEFQGGLGLGMIGRAELSRRPGAELDLLRRFRTEPDVRLLARDLPRFYAACHVLELLRVWMRPDLPAEALHAAAVRTLRALETTRGDALPAWILFFEARAVAATGHAPRLDACAACGRPVAARPYFSAPAGGLVHEACAPPGPGRRVSPAARAALERLHGREDGRAREPLPPGALAEVRAIHDLWLPWLLERRPRGLDRIPRP